MVVATPPRAFSAVDIWHHYAKESCEFMRGLGLTSGLPLVFVREISWTGSGPLTGHMTRPALPLKSGFSGTPLMHYGSFQGRGVILVAVKPLEFAFEW